MRVLSATKTNESSAESNLSMHTYVAFSSIHPGPNGNNEIIWDFDGINEKPPTLESANDVLALNFNGAALPAGLVLTVSVEWAEE